MSYPTDNVKFTKRMYKVILEKIKDYLHEEEY
jgi:hypothetical protein